MRLACIADHDEHREAEKIHDRETANRLSIRTLALFASLAIAGCSIGQGENSMNKPSRGPVTQLEESKVELLFRALLQYQSASEHDAVIGVEGREGAYIGSGDGTIAGEKLQGTVQWSLWAGDCVYPLVRNGQSIPEGTHLCTMNPVGFIETQDGARIRFDGRGYGLRRPEKYRTSLTLVFGTEDSRYVWLTKVLGVMDGEFDEKNGRATWNVYVPTERA
jgi:hypothetical protein